MKILSASFVLCLPQWEQMTDKIHLYETTLKIISCASHIFLVPVLWQHWLWASLEYSTHCCTLVFGLLLRRHILCCFQESSFYRVVRLCCSLGCGGSKSVLRRGRLLYLASLTNSHAAFYCPGAGLFKQPCFPALRRLHVRAWSFSADDRSGFIRA